MDTEKEKNQTVKSGESDCKANVRLVSQKHMPWDRTIRRDPIRHTEYHLLITQAPDFASNVSVVVDSFGNCTPVPTTFDRFLKQYGMKGVSNLCEVVPVWGSEKLEGGVEVGLQ